MTDSNIITAGGVHDFVARWLGVIYGNAYLRHAAHKDWRLLENMPLEGLEARHKQSNVISFHVNRKTHPPVAQTHRSIYRLITSLVVAHCIESDLSLPGFYTFLRLVTGVQESYPEAFANDQRLQAACNDLIIGYWEKVKPSLHDVVYGQSDNMQMDAAAVEGIHQITQEEPSSDKSNQLKAQPPFKKRIQADLKQALSSRPTPTPSLGR
jgi:hypothetical protein